MMGIISVKREGEEEESKKGAAGVRGDRIEVDRGLHVCSSVH